MKIKSFDKETGWATICYEGVDYVVFTPDFDTKEQMKAFVLAQAEIMTSDEKPAFTPVEGETL